MPSAAGFSLPPVLELKDIGFDYAGTRIIEGLDLSVAKGEFVSIVGVSGAGKSTLLRLIVGLEDPGTGTVTMNGDHTIGMVFQDYSLFPWFNLRRNITLALEGRFPGKTAGELDDMAMRQLERVGLAGSGHKLPKELSGGMRQRGAIARALAMESHILLMDEPFGALDAGNRRALQELLTGLTSDGGTTVVFVTHDIEEALLLSDRVVVLAGSPASVAGVLRVPFPKPRDVKRLLADAAFTGLRSRLYGILNHLGSGTSADGLNLFGGGL